MFLLKKKARRSFFFTAKPKRVILISNFNSKYNNPKIKGMTAAIWDIMDLLAHAFAEWSVDWSCSFLIDFFLVFKKKIKEIQI